MEQNAPEERNPTHAERLLRLGFWFVLLSAGLVVLQSLRIHVNLFEYAYTGRDLETTRQFAAMLAWTALCFVGWLAEGRRAVRSGAPQRRASRHDQRGDFSNDRDDGAPRARARLLAAAPLVGIVLIRALDAAGRPIGYVEIPIWLALVSVTTLRLLAIGGRPLAIGPAAAWALIGMSAAAAAAVWTTSLQSVWRGGLLGYPDIGIFANRLQNTWTWTLPFRESTAAAPFWDHFNPALYLLTPLVALIDPTTLLNIAQSVGLASVALVWAAAVRTLGTRMMVAFAMAWLLHPSVSQTTLSLSYGFHAVTLAMPLFAASLVLLRARRWRWFVVCAVAACLFRETVAIGYAGVALWMLSERELRRPGIALLVAASAYFLIVTLAVIPGFSGDTTYVGEIRFKHLGGTMTEVLLSPIRRPVTVLQTMFSRHSMLFAATFFGLLGFLPLLAGGRRLLMLLPEGIFLLLCDEPRIRSVCFHYQSIVLVQAFWIVLDAVATQRGAPGWLMRGVALTARAGNPTTRASAGALLVTALVGAMLLGRWPGSRPTLPTDHVRRRPAVMAAVASWAAGEPSIVATTRAAAHCVGVPDLQTFPEGIRDGRAPAMIILDYGDDWVRVEPIEGLLNTWRLQCEATAHGYAAARRFGEALAFRSDGRASAELIPRETTLRVNAVKTDGQELHPKIEMLGWRVVERPAPDGSEGFELELYLRPTERVQRRLAWMVELRRIDAPDEIIGVSYYAPAGGMVRPTSEWAPGELICDPRGLYLRAGVDPTAIAYGLVVYVVDLDTGEAFEPRAVRPKE